MKLLIEVVPAITMTNSTSMTLKFIESNFLDLCTIQDFYNLEDFFRTIEVKKIDKRNFFGF